MYNFKKQTTLSERFNVCRCNTYDNIEKGTKRKWRWLYDYEAPMFYTQWLNINSK